MLTYSDYFETKEAGNSYFAGANTPNGFEGEYENHISEDSFEKVYMIKGGSGTGKSTLIRRAAETGMRIGGEITYLLCSSDPDSLDGALIRKGERQIAVIDATAPHTMDPRYPGACGELVNCGEYWSAALLEKRRDEIVAKTKAKAVAYERAYKYLSGAGSIGRMQGRLGEYCADMEKLSAYLARLCELVGKRKGSGRITYCRTCAVSMKGAVRLSTFENAAYTVGVADCTYMAPLFYSLLAERLSSEGHWVLASRSPIYGICELSLPEKGISFVPCREGTSYAKRINLSRFADKERMRETKQKRIFSSKCQSSLTGGALESLSEAGEHHYRLENIYKEAMDFDSLTQRTQALCADIEKRLQ